MRLKYLFSVEYLDGSTFQQNAEDVSRINPKKSAFYDVRKDQVKRFTLSDGTNNFTVDLRDGHFEINGIPFYFHEENYKDYRLIFFRKHKHNFNTNFEEISHTVTYRIGWQTTHEGKNVKRIMEFS